MDVGVDVDITSQSIKCFAQHTCVEGTALPSALSQGPQFLIGSLFNYQSCNLEYCYVMSIKPLTCCNSDRHCNNCVGGTERGL